MYNFCLVDKSELLSHNDRKNKSVFTTPEWLEYLEKTNNQPIKVIQIEKNGSVVGFLTGQVVQKSKVRIFAAPFKGWSTCYMGFELYDYSDITTIISEISAFIFKELKCLYIEIVDRFIPIESLGKVTDTNIATDAVTTLELDIDRTDEELFKVFKTDCRNYIRQFERKGAVIKKVKPTQQFVDNYYDQLIEVFAKQNLVPTYSKKKVEDLVFSFKDSDNMLCYEVYDPDGKSIATSIFFSYGDYGYFWGAASYREFQFYRPNEYMIWSAIKEFREKGIKTFDMVGYRKYKMKFGPTSVQYPRIMLSKFKILFPMRNFALKCFYFIQHIKGLKRKLSKK